MTVLHCATCNMDVDSDSVAYADHALHDLAPPLPKPVIKSIFPERIYLVERRAGGGYPTGFASDTWESKKPANEHAEYVRADLLAVVEADRKQWKDYYDGAMKRANENAKLYQDVLQRALAAGVVL